MQSSSLSHTYTICVSVGVKRIKNVCHRTENEDEKRKKREREKTRRNAITTIR